MRPNLVRQKLARGEFVMGMMHFTASPMLVEVMASAGLDFFIIDFEHSPIDLEMAAHLVRAGDAAGISPLLRIPSVEAGLVKKVLNLGIQGLVLPHGTQKSCQELLKAVRYEPEGLRGSCPAIRQANYGEPKNWKEFQEQANKEILVIPLIEDPATLDGFETLAATPGLDVFFLGPFDFSVAAGVPGASFDNPIIAGAIDRMVAVARKHGKYVMTSVGDQIDTKLGQGLLRQGVRMISYSADALVFKRACQDIARLKNIEKLSS